MAEEKRTLLGMLTGAVLFDIFVCIVCLLVQEAPGTWITGILFGGAVSVGLGIHMLWGIERTLWLEEKSAGKYARRLSAFRMFIMMAALAVSGVLPQYLNILGTAAGLFGLKIGTYLQPFIDKILIKIFK